MTFGKKLKALMISQGVRPKDIAGAVHYSYRTIEVWKSGQVYPGLVAMKSLADYFDLTLAELLEGVDEV